MLPPVPSDGLGQSFGALTSAGDACSRAFHLGGSPGFGGGFVCVSNPPSASTTRTLLLLPSGWKDFNHDSC